jgi:NADH-quinone oxidoreductase subunit L
MNAETTTYGLLGLIPLLPALGALFNAVFGSKLPKKAVHTVAVGTMLVAFVLAIISVVTIAQGGVADGHGHTTYPALTYEYFTWFAVHNLEISATLYLDTLSAVMLLIITGVGFLIHLYSIGYMEGDESYSRYFTYLNLFIFAMLMLVLGDSVVVLFLGWEGVGLASYLLIGFWYSDEAKASAGKKAFITNRVGDFAVLIGMFLVFNLFGTLSIPEMREVVSQMGEGQLIAISGLITAACICFFIGCTGKSAQIPLYVWLPDAMAGPTPVSALIHAATMVTAGVYLIARMNFLFALSPLAMTIVMVVGALTAFFAATIGCTQFDIKKVLAYSTVSQLGFMFVAVGAGSFFAGIFHLMTHAFFKALLFLGSGSVIHGMHHEQDIRKMGGLRKYMPITSWTFLLACLAIAGFPLFSGFFSKDEILWYALANENVLGGTHIGWIVWGISLAAAALTAFYMFRLYFLPFEGECRADDETKEHIHESPWTMTVPLMVLAALSVVGGFIGVPYILGDPLGIPNVLHDWLHGVIWPGEALFDYAVPKSFAWLSMGAATLVGLGGIGVAWFMYREHDPTEDLENAGKAYHVVYDKYYVDEFYGATVVRGVRDLGRAFYHFVDVVLIDLLLVRMWGYTLDVLGSVLRQFQNGNVQRYAAYTVLGLGVILYVLLT